MNADIIRMAREAGWSFMEAGMDAQRLARFAALVRADECEACAQVCDRWAKYGIPAAVACADEIRTRSKE